MKTRFDSLQKRFRDPVFCVWTSFVAAVLFAFFLTAINGVPLPSVHDEFAYLLGADTYASGRATNPTHPMWEHFETFHVIHQPTYISKYQPAQSLTLALGNILGHPFIGACLATGIAVAALVWMLTGWLPRNYFGWVWLFSVLHPGIQILWGQSYWGGAVPLMGAALMLGALGRLSSKMEIRYSVLAGLGTLLLANSRPFEGAVLTAMVGTGLLWKLARNPKWKWTAFLTRGLLPGAIVLGAGVGAMMTYNHAVTGDAWVMPYQINQAAYGWNPIFLWQTAGEKPDYRHEIMERFYEMDKSQTESRYRTLSDVVRLKTRTAMGMVQFFCGPIGLLALLGSPWSLRKSRYRFALVLLLPVFIASLTTPWGFAHYCAPAAPLIILLAFGSGIEIWKRIKSSPLHATGRQMGGALLVFFLAMWLGITLRYYRQSLSHEWARDRDRFEKKLLSEPGQDLVLVRYADDHNPNAEWVYNAADINASGVVWAREISPERRDDLIDYFSDRSVWVVDVDHDPPVLKRY